MTLCRHTKRTETSLIIIEGCRSPRSGIIVGEVEKKVYCCNKCRVLFVPWESEKITNLHEEKPKE